MPQTTGSSRQYLLASDFDQTLSFKDSGIVLSELLGTSGFEDKVAGLAHINLVQQGGELAYLLLRMSDRNEDDLNALSRKTISDVQLAALQGSNQAYMDAARPTTDLVLPVLSEHTMGQLMQMLMLATVVEGRLMNINPYGQSGVEAYKRNMNKILRGDK